MGYGISDLQFSQEDNSSTRRMTDLRINWEAFNDVSEEVYEVNWTKFIRWMGAKRTVRTLARLWVKEFPQVKLTGTAEDHIRHEVKILKCIRGPSDRRNRHWSLGNSIIHRSECGLPNVMVVVPPEMYPDWHHHDGDIDYQEETEVYGQKNRVVPLVRQSGIYPYGGTMIRFRDPPPQVGGELVEKGGSLRMATDDKGPVRMEGGRYNLLVGRWSENQPPLVKGKALKHLQEDWRPRIPLSVLGVATWLNHKGCLEDIDSFLDDLRPLLYVYWA